MSPQVINNWKSRDFVPSKYVDILKTKIKLSQKRSKFPVSENASNSGQSLSEMLLYSAALAKQLSYNFVFANLFIPIILHRS